MSSAIIGALASQFLPQIAQWGYNKLRGTNIGRGIGNKAKKLKKMAYKVLENPYVRKAAHTIANTQCDQNPRKRVKIDQSKNVQYQPSNIAEGDPQDYEGQQMRKMFGLQ